LGNPRDGRHAKIHQNLGEITHQDRQSPDLGDTLHLNILPETPELDELHQLFTIVLGVESSGLRLHQHHLTQAQVLLSPVELNLLLPQHLVEAEGMLGMVVCTSILLRYSFRVASAFAISTSSSTLTLTRALSEIFTFSSRTARASSLCVNSSSHARSCTCSSLATTAVDATTTKGGGRGGERRGLHKV
jgi:hypothetical protein